MLWVSVRAYRGVLPVVVGPVRDFIAAAGDAAKLPAEYLASVLEWTPGDGLIAVWNRCGDHYELAWEAAGAEVMREGVRLAPVT
jgi:hypothetical protein